MVIKIVKHINIQTIISSGSISPDLWRGKGLNTGER